MAGEALVTPFVAPAPSNVTATQTARFPVPPTSWGFATDVEDAFTISRISTPLSGAVSPEGVYLEPTIGQIWPR